MAKEKNKETTGGYISVDRNEALQKNWPEISKMSRPATMPVAATPPVELPEPPKTPQPTKK